MEIVIVRLGMIMKILLDNKRYADAKRAFDYIDQRLFCKEEGTVI